MSKLVSHDIWETNPFSCGEENHPRVENPGVVEEMDIKAFRHYFEYHFSENRNLWDKLITGLSDEQFTREADYSHGSIRSQLVHLMSVDDTWFRGLQGRDIPEPLGPKDFPDRETLRRHWDGIEQNMRTYLANLHDRDLVKNPLEGEDKDLTTWQVLLQVVNHGTDHRAQILRLLQDMGVKTTSQDYIFFAYDHPQ